jgi:hypothetical protein
MKGVYVYGPIELKGFQSIIKPSNGKWPKYQAQFETNDEKLISKLEEDFAESLEFIKSKVKDTRRVKGILEPWVEVEDRPGYVQITARRNPEKGAPVIVDSEGTVITSTTLPLFSGSKVRLKFRMKAVPVVANPCVTFELLGCQVISLSANGGYDGASDDVAASFGRYEGGFVADDPQPQPNEEENTEEDDDEVPF